MAYQWGDIDQAGTEERFFVDYLDKASALKQTQDYKHQTLRMLGLEPGQRVLDVGCGAGVDLLSLAHIVGPAGSVIGIDNSQIMVDTAAERLRELDWVNVERGDANELRYEDARFHACRADRVFIHLEQAEVALDEMLRVLKPGGRLLIADPQYETVTVDNDAPEITRAVVQHLVDENRNPYSARQTYRLFRQRKLMDIQVQANTAVFHDLATADQILGLRAAAKALGEQGVIKQTHADSWLKELAYRDQQGEFQCTITGLATAGTKE